MSRDRYDDRQLAMMRRLAGALVDVIKGCGWTHFEGKLAYLNGELREEEEMRSREIATMFVPPAEQIANLVRWNERRGWGFTQEAIDALAKEVPPAPTAPPKGRPQLKARTLEIHLPDGADGMPGYRRTFDELWDIIVREQGMRPFHLFGLGPNVRLALMPGIVHEPGLRWRVIDLGNGWPEADPHCTRMCGTSPRSLPPEAERPHAGVLAAAAHFPLWLARMDGTHVPYAWLPGYELPGVPHSIGAMRDRVIHHPALTGEAEGRVFLYYQWDHVPFETHAVPIYADAKAGPPVAEGDGFGG